MLDNIFSSEKLNTGRQREMDWLKGLIVIVMLLNHVHYILLQGKDIMLFSFNSEMIRRLIGPTAFMFCMGMGCIYSKKNAWNDNIRRGIMLISFGFGLHIFFYPICTFFVYQFTHDSYDLMLLLGTYGSDILHFAGLSFLLIGAMKAIKQYSVVKVLIVGILLSVLGTFINNLNVDNHFLNQTIGFFVGNDDTHFPFINWFIYVAAGIAYGELYTRIKDKAAYHRIVLPVSLVLSIILLYISFNVPNPLLLKYSHSDFYHYRVGVFDAIVDILVVICAISLLAQLPEKLPIGIIGDFSKYLMNYYIISWIVLEVEVCTMKLAGIYSDFPAALLPGLCLLALTTVLTHLGVKLYLKYGRARLGPFFASPIYMTAAIAIAVAFELCIIHYIYG